MRRVVGRERELATVARFLEDVNDGCVALVLEGDAGVGKTTVWLEAVRLADEAGYRVLRCSPAQSEAKLAFASVTDLLATVTTCSRNSRSHSGAPSMSHFCARAQWMVDRTRARSVQPCSRL